jgi:coatomer subunit beta
LTNTLPTIKSGKVFRGILWILGEYVEDQESVNDVLQEIRKVIGEIPIGASEQRALDEANGGEEEKDKNAENVSVPSGGGRPKVLADGTYATETAYTSAANVKLEAVKAAAKPPLRSESYCYFCVTKTIDYMSCSSHSWWRFLHECRVGGFTYEACDEVREVVE